MPNIGRNFQQILPFSPASLGTGIDPGPTVNEFGTEYASGVPGDLVLAAGNPVSPASYQSAFDAANKNVYSVNQTATITPFIPVNPNAAVPVVVKQNNSVLYLGAAVAAYFLFLKKKRA